jgi:hypothetical protein
VYVCIYIYIYIRTSYVEAIAHSWSEHSPFCVASYVRILLLGGCRWLIGNTTLVLESLVAFPREGWVSILIDENYNFYMSKRRVIAAVYAVCKSRWKLHFKYLRNVASLRRCMRCVSRKVYPSNIAAIENTCINKYVICVYMYISLDVVSA